MVKLDLVSAAKAWRYYRAIEPSFYRFPALRAARFEDRMRLAFGPEPKSAGDT